MSDDRTPPPNRTFSLDLVAPRNTAIDPVCGMTVDPDTARGGSHTHDGTTYYFCAENCRRKFAADPQKYLAGHRDRMEMANPERERGDALEIAPLPRGRGSPTRYICPMDPEVVSDRPGACPKCGMALEPETPSVDEDLPDPELRSMTWRFWLGVALGVPLIGLAMADMFLPGEPVSHAMGHVAFMVLQAVLCTPVVLVCGWPFFERFATSVRNRAPNMFTLIGLGVGVAYLYSLYTVVDAITRGHVHYHPYFESAAGIVVLVLLGQVLELRARRATGDAVRKLLKLAPRTARVVTPHGTEEDIPIELVAVGDRVRVRPGERVPVDGVIRDGVTTVDESMLTGEPMPVDKAAGAAVMTGTLNGNGSVVIEATRVGGDTLLSKMVALVGEAQRSRVPIQRLVDRISVWFVPAVLVAAVLTFVGWAVFGTGEQRFVYGFVCAVSVLVIACPCALGLATPMAIVVGTGRAARGGILFRDAAALETLARVDTVVFDKTGTLTEGKPKVAVIEANPGADATEMLALAAAVERGSEHPIGHAIVGDAVNRKLEIPAAADVQTFSGKGIRGVVNGREALLGTAAFLAEHRVRSDIPEARPGELRQTGHTVVLVAAGGKCLGLIAVADPVRPTTRDTLLNLLYESLDLVLLTGDNAATARHVLNTLEIGMPGLRVVEVIADTLPADKHKVIAKLKAEGRVVAMCGDGINDAPALAAADVGIAMGTGTDVAISAAGVTLVKPDLWGVVVARDLSRRTIRTIRQNLFLAFVYNLVAVPVAAGLLVPFGGGLISPIWAAAAMSLSSVSVIANSLRLRG